MSSKTSEVFSKLSMVQVSKINHQLLISPYIVHRFE